MQFFKDILSQAKNAFLNKFSKTTQLLLDSYLGNYLDDPLQIKLENLMDGVQNLKLNKQYLNNLIGFNLVELKEANIDFIQIKNLKLDISNINFVFQQRMNITEEQFLQHVHEYEQIRQLETSRIDRLKEIRQQIYQQNELDKSINQSVRQISADGGLSQFFDLIETVLGNSSINIEKITINLIFGNQTIELTLKKLQIDLEKQQNMRLFSKVNISEILLHFNQHQIGQMKNAIDLKAYFEVVEKRLTPKIICQISLLKFMVDIPLVKQFSKIIKDQNQQLDKLTQFQQRYQGEYDQIQQSQQLLSSIKEQSFNLNNIKMINYGDMQNSIRQDIEPDHYFQSVFQSTNIRYDQENSECVKLKQQKQNIILKFKGIIGAVAHHQKYGEFDDSKFFCYIDNHTYIRIINITITQDNNKLNLVLNKMLIAEILQSEPSMFLSAQSNTDMFKSVVNQRTVKLIPILLFGFKIKQKYVEGSVIYKTEMPNKQCQSKVAVLLDITTHKGRDQNYTQIDGKIGDLIVLINDEQIKSLLEISNLFNAGGAPQVNNQQKLIMSTIISDIQIKSLSLHLSAFNRYLQADIENIQFLKKLTKQVPIKIGVLYSWEQQPVDEEPTSLSYFTFDKLQIYFETYKILYLGLEQHIEFIQQPIITISEQNKSNKQGENQFETAKNQSQLVIRGSIPRLDISINEQLIKWLLDIQNSFKDYLNKQEQPQQQNQQYIQIILESINFNIFSGNYKLLSVELFKNTIILCKHTLFGSQSIQVLDKNFNQPLTLNQDKFMQNKSPTNFLYSIANNVRKNSMITSKRNYFNPFIAIDHRIMNIKVLLDPNPQIYLKNICFKVYDFQFLLFKQLLEFSKLFDQQQEKQPSPKFKINLDQIYIDIQPYKIQNHQLFYGQTRSLININEAQITEEQIIINQLIYYISRHDGSEQYCRTLQNSFDQLESQFNFYRMLCVSTINIGINSQIVSINDIGIKLKMDVIDTLSDHLKNINLILDLPNNQQQLQVHPYQYNIQRFMNDKPTLFQSKPIDKSSQQYLFDVNKIQISIEEGHAFDIKIEDFQDDDFEIITSSKSTDLILIVLENFSLQVNQFEDLQMIRLATNILILDKIKDSKFAIVLDKDSTVQHSFLACFIIEQDTYSVFLNIYPLRICVSGYLLEFIQMIQNQPYKIQIEDDFEIIEENVINKSQKINLKQFEMSQTAFIVSYDSSGLLIDGMLKGLLRISSFKNMELQLSSISGYTEGNAIEIQQYLQERLIQSLGSQLSLGFNAITSLQALSIINSVVIGFKSLISKPFQQGIVVGTKNGVQDLTKGLAISLIKALTLPTNIIKQIGEQFGLNKYTAPLGDYRVLLIFRTKFHKNTLKSISNDQDKQLYYLFFNIKLFIRYIKHVYIFKLFFNLNKIQNIQNKLHINIYQLINIILSIYLQIQKIQIRLWELFDYKQFQYNSYDRKSNSSDKIILNTCLINLDVFIRIITTNKLNSYKKAQNQSACFD
ncbi:hypothetical protein pb186bvf_018474 [Paramecium bursaria]